MFLKKKTFLVLFVVVVLLLSLSGCTPDYSIQADASLKTGSFLQEETVVTARRDSGESLCPPCQQFNFGRVEGADSLVLA